MGTRSDLSEFWVILHHELTACRRDWRPIVLSWLFPVLVLGFGAALGGFTVGGELSHHFKVAVDDPDGKNQAFIQELKRYNHDIDITPSKNAAEDLRERKVEAAFSFSPDQKKVTVTMPVGGMSERLTQRMKNTVQAAR